MRSAGRQERVELGSGVLRGPGGNRRVGERDQPLLRDPDIAQQPDRIEPGVYGAEAFAGVAIRSRIVEQALAWRRGGMAARGHGGAGA